MNRREREMVDLLRDLRETHGAIGVKAEFEVEGTRVEEAMRLKDVVATAGLGLTMKVGGPEAIIDLQLARLLGVREVVAPMVETAFGLTKALGAMALVFAADEREDTRFVVNVETISACRELDAMLALPEAAMLGGVVVGRVDLAASMGLSREHIQGERVRELTIDVFEKARAKGLRRGIGGGVDAGNVAFYRALPTGLLDYFETRKVVFRAETLTGDADSAMAGAAHFELGWLERKIDYYAAISHEDDARLQMLRARVAGG
jgi:4-hydroxy-2-oxoheptanedioate aldolase